jgi:hypothetical protein
LYFEAETVEVDLVFFENCSADTEIGNGSKLLHVFAAIVRLLGDFENETVFAADLDVVVFQVVQLVRNYYDVFL